MLKGILLAVATFLFFLSAHFLLFRTRPPRRRFDAMVRLDWLLVPVLR